MTAELLAETGVQIPRQRDGEGFVQPNTEKKGAETEQETSGLVRRKGAVAFSAETLQAIAAVKERRRVTKPSSIPQTSELYQGVGYSAWPANALQEIISYMDAATARTTRRRNYPTQDMQSETTETP